MNCQHNKYTYISLNTIESIYIDLHERQMTQGGIHVYLKVWQYKHIHEVKTHETNPKMEYKFKMYELSKLDYTSTSNGFK